VRNRAAPCCDANELVATCAPVQEKLTNVKLGVSGKPACVLNHTPSEERTRCSAGSGTKGELLIGGECRDLRADVVLPGTVPSSELSEALGLVLDKLLVQGL
jgi:hypothetical protein